jgi:hypothetical protein
MIKTDNHGTLRGPGRARPVLQVVVPGDTFAGAVYPRRALASEDGHRIPQAERRAGVPGAGDVRHDAQRDGVPVADPAADRQGGEQRPGIRGPAPRYASRVAARWYRDRSAKKHTAYAGLIDTGDIMSAPRLQALLLLPPPVAAVPVILGPVETVLVPPVGAHHVQLPTPCRPAAVNAG